MNLLPDTHTIIWWLENSVLLSKKGYSALKDPENNIFLSTISVWEISLKQSMKKLQVPGRYLKILLDSNFQPLNITFKHAAAIKDLPFYHKDPFDRLLIAQTQVEGLTLVSRDKVFKKYGVKVLW